MKTEIIKNTELPLVIPHGKLQEVAEALNVNPKTISRHVKKGRGLMYDKIKKVVLEKFGK